MTVGGVGEFSRAAAVGDRGKTSHYKVRDRYIDMHVYTYIYMCVTCTYMYI